MKTNQEHTKSNPVWSPLFFSLAMVAGMFIGFNLKDSLRNKQDITITVEGNGKLEELIDLLHDKYFDTLNKNALFENAISGILKNLDPHTTYISTEDLQVSNDDLNGSFSGIGIEYTIVKDTIEVVAVLDNSPAKNAGMLVGDQLIKVGDSIVAGTQINAGRILHLLRGKQKSVVAITLKNVLNGAIKTISVTRDDIPVNSVTASFLIENSIVYLKLSRFSAHTYEEFSKAFEALQKQGAKQLILDLRDNPGGFLNAATALANEFFSDKKLLVYTKGAHSLRTEYKSDGKGSFDTGRLVVLINEGSASASEILSGAVQDWDRGIIIGRRSFGKGLVQEQFDLSYGAAIRVTVAKYYTPSGRCIQRPFTNGKEAYMKDYVQRLESSLTYDEQELINSDSTPYYTSNNRIVHAGGGIKPDIIIPFDTAYSNPSFVQLYESTELKEAVLHYFINNRSKLFFKNFDEFASKFKDEEKIIKDFIATKNPEEKNKIIKILSGNKNNEFFMLQVKAQMARLLFQDNGYYAVIIKDDKMVKEAIRLMHSPEYHTMRAGVGLGK